MVGYLMCLSSETDIVKRICRLGYNMSDKEQLIYDFFIFID